MDTLVRGKATIITGAGSGMGRAMALRFAAGGARVIAADVTGAEEAVAREAGGETIPVRCDVADETQVVALVERCVEVFGRVDVVCNNAGVSGAQETLHLYPTAEWDRVMGIDLRAPFLVLKHSIAAMLGTGGGAIVNTSSVGGFRATPGFGAYTVAKAGVIMLTRQAAAEYAAHGVRVNAICPGMMDTPIIAGISEDVRSAITAQIPVGRLGQPEEAAALALFLASDEASYITGQSYTIDGGYSA